MEYEQTTQEETSRVEQTTSAEQFNQSEFFREHLSRTDNGSYEIKGDDLSPLELALLDTEKRRRGSQAATSREKARADRYELEIDKVKTALPTMEHRQTVDANLKYTDPDEYIRLTLAAQADNPYEEVFNTASQQAADEVGQSSVEHEINSFNLEHPQTPITPDMLEMDLPPRLLNELAAGKIAPQDFLAQAADILYRPTETHNPTIPVTPDLGAVGGQTTPTDDGSNDKMAAQYASAVF